MLAPNNLIEHLCSLSKIEKKGAIHVRNKSRIKNNKKRAKRTARNIDQIQNQILQYLCLNPDSTAYDICRKRVLYVRGYVDDCSLIRRCISDLSEKGLIKRAQKKTIEHNAKPCRLTINGVYHLILRLRIMPDNIMKAILKNYGDDILFHQFLYPYISRDAVLKINDVRLVSRISLFLYECCRDIDDVLTSTRKGHAVEQVFFWQSVPDKMDETDRLRQFLKRELNMSWMDLAQDFHKTNHGSKLIISHGSNLISITLNDKKTKAILRAKRKELYEFLVETAPNGLLIIEAPTKSAEDFLASSLFLGIIQRVDSLILNLLMDVEQDSPDFGTLSQDKKFMSTLKGTKIKIDKKYQVIAK